MKPKSRPALLALLLTIALLVVSCTNSAAEPIPTLDATAEIFATMVAEGGEIPSMDVEMRPTAEAAATLPQEAPQAPETATAEPTATPQPSPTATTEPSPTPSPTPIGPIDYTYEVINTYPHDPNAWTQGLVIDRGVLFEGTGQWDASTLREVALETGAVLRSVPLDGELYGEGITVLGDRIYQITWQNNLGIVYDRTSFEILSNFTYPTEGWGITHDGERLIVSDGTAMLYFWDPETLTEIGRIEVSDNTGPINMLNELEYIDGEIFANIWLEDRIARIDPETGRVTGWIDMTGLLDRSELIQEADVLNGIAYDHQSGRMFVTGKLWPAMFEVNIVPKP